MALVKTIALSNGVDVSYHRIVSVNYNKDSRKCQCLVQSYVSKEIRDSVNKSVKSESVELSNVLDLSLSNLYTLLKAKAEFENAENS